MLYPFSLTLDLYIQAESFEEAKKLAEAYVQDASLDTTDYPEDVEIYEVQIVNNVLKIKGRDKESREKDITNHKTHFD